MRDSKETRLQRLRELVDDPPARAEYALTLLQPRYRLEVVRAALRVLVRNPHPPARPALIQLYEHYASQGVSRDPGTYLRSEIVRALRPFCEPSDVGLLEQALMTYEFPPPSFVEEAALLRSGALVTLAEVDDIRARYHATRLLADPLTDPMSGEPALTAVTVLAAQGELLPLYFYCTQEVSRMQAEVASACLRSLGEIPVEALSPLVAAHAETSHPVILVGLADLLLQHPEAMVSQETLARLLQEVKDIDLYRYLAAVLLASGSVDLRNLVLAMAGSGMLQAEKRETLLDVLGEAGESEDVLAAMAKLQIRRPKQSR